MNMRAPQILALATCFMWGCDITWSEGSGYEHATFSETGDNVVVVFQTYEKKDNGKYTEKRNFETQVVLVDETGDKQTLTELAEGDVADLFYQEEAGYIILGRSGEPESEITGSMHAWFAYERISLDGTVTPLGGGSGPVMLSCDGGESSMSVSPPVRWIPSPDGAMLARIDAEITCLERSMTLTFVDALSLAVLYGPIPLDDGGQISLPDGGVFWNTLSMAWTEADMFAIGNWAKSSAMDHLGADVYEPGQSEPTEALMHFACFSAPTASNYKRMDGAEVSVSEDGVVTIDTDPQWDNGFGCGGN